MAKCTHCSAPLPRNSIICEYCAVRNDIELQAKNIGATLPKSKRTCPDCLIYLDSVDIGKNNRFIIEKCSRCYGLFFDHHEMERLLEENEIKSYWVDHQKLHSLLQHPLHKDRVIYRRCPECNKIMHRKNYLKRSGVITDLCADHGLWLDAGELKQIQDWIKLGGKRNALKDKLDEKHIQNRAKERKRADLNRTKNKGNEASEAVGLDDLFETISTIFRHGLRF